LDKKKREVISEKELLLIRVEVTRNPINKDKMYKEEIEKIKIKKVGL